MRKWSNGRACYPDLNHAEFSGQLRPRSRLEIADLQLDAAEAVPVIDAWSESQAAAAVGGHQIVGALGHAEGDGADIAVLLPNAEADVPLATAHLARHADNL